MNEIKNFTIIIPCIKITDVENCLTNIRKYYKTVKINVCLNEKVEKSKYDKNIKFIYTKSESIGQKRNLAVKAAKTKYLAFIDSDAFPKKNWIESSTKFFKLKNVGIIAGPNINPKKQNYFENLIGIIKSSFLITMKPGFQRGYIKKAQFVKFLPSVNWILKKKIFNINGNMNSKMLRNEDWDFVYKLRKKKLKVFYSPTTIVFHKSGTIRHFISKRFKYGYYMWNILNKPNSENYYFYFPMIFCAFLISFPLIFFFKLYNILYLSVCVLFLLIVLIEALRIMDKVKNLFYIFVLLIVCTLSPGFGILSGLIFNFKKT